jgi:uncharacterized protein YecE (DUF72 family)
MQFPWSFRFTEANREFLVLLRRAFAEFPLVVEMRHRTWLHEEALGMLIDYHLGFCNIDQPQDASAMPPASQLTSAIGYVRLHGRTSDYLYSTVELEQWKARIEHLVRFADAVFVVTNNDIGGKSIVNALQLQVLFGLDKICAPRQLASLFRRELELFHMDAPVQSCLFPTDRRVA